jgi:hypothetical protein
MADKQCQSIERENLIAGSWECCQCNVLNGGYREACKSCSHARCFYPAVSIEGSSSIEEIEALPASIDIKPIDRKLLN